MNPFTRSLLQRLEDRRLAEFVGYWDALESRILAHVAHGDEQAGWYGELADMMRDRPGR